MSKVLQPLLIASMLVCCVAPLVIYGEQMIAGWRGGYLLIMTFIAVIEGIWSSRIYKRERVYDLERLWRWMAEAAVLLLVTKLVSYMGKGIEVLLSDFAIWIKEPIRIITLESLLASFTVLMVWFLGQSMQADFERLTDLSESGADRQLARARLINSTFAGGVWLLVVSGGILALSNWYPVTQGNLFRSIQSVVVAYSALSLLLFAHVHYLRRKMEWTLEGIVIPSKIGRRWVNWGVVVIMGVILAAAFLPAMYSFGPERLFIWVFDVFGFFMRVVAFVLLMVCSPVFWLFNLLIGEQASLPETPPDLTLPPSFSPSAPPAWWITLRQIFLYLLIVTALSFVLVTFLRDRRISLPAAEILRNWLRQVFMRFRRWLLRLGGHTKRILREVRFRRSLRRKEPTQKPTRISLFYARSPRGRIRRYYLSFLQRAMDAGHGRDPQQTPYEYADRLAAYMADQQSELSTLTEGFIRARYSTREMSVEEASTIRGAWQKLRNRLRQWKSR
jgi:hypothetical protein